MTKEQQELILEGFQRQMRELLLSKGDDYSQEEDRLSNFKTTANIIGSTPEKNCLVFMATKVARLGALLQSNQNPNHESIVDTLIDLANYSALMAMILAESSNPQKTKENV